MNNRWLRYILIVVVGGIALGFNFVEKANAAGCTYWDDEVPPVVYQKTDLGIVAYTAFLPRNLSSAILVIPSTSSLPQQRMGSIEHIGNTMQIKMTFLGTSTLPANSYISLKFDAMVEDGTGNQCREIRTQLYDGAALSSLSPNLASITAEENRINNILSASLKNTNSVSLFVSKLSFDLPANSPKYYTAAFYDQLKLEVYRKYKNYDYYLGTLKKNQWVLFDSIYTDQASNNYVIKPQLKKQTNSIYDDNYDNYGEVNFVRNKSVSNELRLIGNPTDGTPKTVYIDGVHNFRNVDIQDGWKVEGKINFSLTVNSADGITVGTNSAIDYTGVYVGNSGKGGAAPSSHTSCSNDSNCYGGGGGGGHAGKGGSGSSSTGGALNNGGSITESTPVSNPSLPGGAGGIVVNGEYYDQKIIGLPNLDPAFLVDMGAYSAGGGVVKLLTSGQLVNNGSIWSNGAPGCPTCNYQTHGGGAGGSIILTASKIINRGQIRALGGAGTPGTGQGSDYLGVYRYAGGGGAGGAIAINGVYSSDGVNELIIQNGASEADGGKVTALGQIGNNFGGWPGSNGWIYYNSTSTPTSTPTSTLTSTLTSTPTVTLKVNDLSAATIQYNTPVTLTWESTNAALCTASGSWSGTKSVNNISGEATGNLTANKSYTLGCVGSNGGSASSTATVNVVVPQPVTWSLKGSFAAKNIIFDLSDLTINYDPRVTVVPPPGFSGLYPAGLQEGY